jgi:hypothetical protein
MLLDAVRPLESSVNLYQTARRRITEDCNSYGHRHENLKFRNVPLQKISIFWLFLSTDESSFFNSKILTKSAECFIRYTCMCDVTKSSPQDGAQHTSLGVLEETSCLISWSRNSCASVGIMTFGPPNLCGLQPQLILYCVCQNAKECRTLLKITQLLSVEIKFPVAHLLF